MKSKLTTILLICLLLAGIMLLFVNPIQNKMIAFNTEALLQKPITPVATVAEASFDFEEVQSIELTDVVAAQLTKEDTPVISRISIPTVQLNLPIGKGVAESVLLYGAGTMKADQVLGEGNYALASHYIEGQNVLFGPLYHVEIGDHIFINDEHSVYEYVIRVKEIILETDVQVIEDVPEKTLLTLITCAEKGAKRLLVQAEFLNKTPIANE